MLFIDKQIEYFQGKKETIIQKLSQMVIYVLKQESKKSQLLYNLDIKSLKELRVAGVMDRFTLDSYAPECNLLELTPDNWKEEIEQFKPHMLFIESAWQGKDKAWYRKIANGSKEYFEMTSYCQEREIPIVFWNKEDPVWTDTFMPAARMADFVFTTDVDCIKKYKDTLKHDRVYFLHFAAQPEVHNPIEKYVRKDKYCFAGAYYHKYKKRAEIFDKFAQVFIKTKGYDIYDRNYQSSLPEHAFPESYNPYILGKLDPSEIDIAYKGYNYGVNMNSVDQSQTMFARRVFEMLASNTVTVGNYSRGVKNLFGDLTICTDDNRTLEKELTTWCKDTVTYRKYRLVGLRKVLSEHLYEDRLGYIVEKVFGKSLKKPLPSIAVIANVNSVEAYSHMSKMLDSQTYENKKVYFVSAESSLISSYSDVISVDQFEQWKWDKLDECDYVCVLNSENYYGKNYLLDLALTVRYGLFNGIGKRAFYKSDKSDFVLINEAEVYKACSSLFKDRSIFRIQYCMSRFENPMKFMEEELLNGEGFYAIDEFNFCTNCLEDKCDFVDDLNILDQGIQLKEIEKQAEGIKRSLMEETQGKIFGAREILGLAKFTNNNLVTGALQQDKLLLNCSMKDAENHYVYLEKLFEVKEFEANGKLKLVFDGNGSIEFIGVCIFYDKYQKKLTPVFANPNRIVACDIPSNAYYIKLGMRLKGTGEYSLSSIGIGVEDRPNERGCFLTRSNTLVLSNIYPSPENLYRNMFVHKRLMAYKDRGKILDVMRMNIYAKDGFSEFEGINIVEGQSEALANILEHGTIDTVCVHFLEKQMWEVLKPYLHKIRLIIWSHGADIQPWWRRSFMYKTEEELNKAKKASEHRMELWQEVFSVYKEYNIEFVFVSQYSADMVMEDYKCELSKERYHIIPNCIDTNMFTYMEKEAEQRKKIISIRPYASSIYGNDLTAKAIKELSKEEFFDDLQFLIIGDGVLFDETVAPIRKYKNVDIKRTFLRQSEIADLYHEYGVVLIPTRGDTQGVSRDEAMSCGVVPVTNAVAAIPEFTDETCAMLAKSEDYKGLAEGIKQLYGNENMYLNMSQNAARRVRSQTSPEHTICKELELLSV